jgi:arylsulfatase
VKLPEKNVEGQPTIFDSYDMTPVVFGTGKSPREEWFYFTEDELSPGAFGWHQFKFVFNLSGDDRGADRWTRRGRQSGLERPGEIRRGSPADFLISGRILRNATTFS